MPGSILRSAECAEREDGEKAGEISRGVPARGEKDCTPHEIRILAHPTPPISGPTARGAGSSRRPGPPTAVTSRRARARATPREVPTLGAGAYPLFGMPPGTIPRLRCARAAHLRLTLGLDKNLMARSCQNASQPRTLFPTRCGRQPGGLLWLRISHDGSPDPAQWLPEHGAPARRSGWHPCAARLAAARDAECKSWPAVSRGGSSRSAAAGGL